MSRIRRPTSRFVTAALLAAGVPLLAQTGPAPVPTHLDADVIALACSPTLMFERRRRLAARHGRPGFSDSSPGTGPAI